MEDEAYMNAIKVFETTQAEKGDAGCFAELYPELRSAAAKILVAKSWLSSQEYSERMLGLQDIASSLPGLHDLQVLETARLRIVKLTAFSISPKV